MSVSTVSSIFMHLTNIYLAPLYAGAALLSKEDSSCREPGPLALWCTPLGGETDPKGANQTPYGPVRVGVSAGRTCVGPLWTGLGLGLGLGLCGALRVGVPGRRQLRGYESVMVGVSAHRPVWLASWGWGMAGAEVREGDHAPSPPPARHTTLGSQGRSPGTKLWAPRGAFAAGCLGC